MCPGHVVLEDGEGGEDLSAVTGDVGVAWEAWQGRGQAPRGEGGRGGRTQAG